jgi:hypothetical protein
MSTSRLLAAIFRVLQEQRSRPLGTDPTVDLARFSTPIYRIWQLPGRLISSLFPHGELARLCGAISSHKKPLARFLVIATVQPQFRMQHPTFGVVFLF